MSQATVPDTTVGELNHRAEAAHQAYLAARDVPPNERKSWLYAIADGLDANSLELIDLADQESHLGGTRLAGELKRTSFQLRLLADEAASGEPLQLVIDHADPDWGMGPRPDIRRMNVPFGVVGVFGASNFPFAFSVIGGDSAAALAAGCSVVHKAHEAHPRLAVRTAEIVISALDGAGAPAGLFSLVTGVDAGAELVQHPLVQAVGFTGSTRGGRALFNMIADRPEPIPFYGELGSTNPVFVAPVAWRQRPAEIISGYLGSAAMGVGQFCTKPGLLIVPAGADLPALLAGADVGRRLGQMLTQRLEDGFLTALQEMRERHGISTLAGGAGTDELTVLSTTAENVLAEPEILQQEMFGPATLIIEYSRDGALVDLAEALDGQLTATLQADDDDDVDGLVRVLNRKAGRLLWNGWPTGVTVSYGQQHGGPYPASTASATTSVGTAAIQRFLRPVAYQDFPQQRLPAFLRDDNPPPGLRRRVDGVWTETGL
ncbi:aldehyde dehydrogenase (NADP(+)) [Microlunatus sp. Gsoil 973]|uniref:aldehyde dehydrogenase (NADP(+)) n=1 Tax=Microlunatus sp. Gsoil 973 TaxID=2672569 RepID=UPI0012B4D9AC|nr:aldehyde dehydrogenase (NADP(+)) [Microlunatus sp. Gsoil 973]QGN31753.1 aldehyde dehydrogenase family protein [Microlunatus sp. Gsoil 973]